MDVTYLRHLVYASMHFAKEDEISGLTYCIALWPSLTKYSKVKKVDQHVFFKKILKSMDIMLPSAVKIIDVSWYSTIQG